jgi:hypothetical protein
MEALMYFLILYSVLPSMTLIYTTDDFVVITIGDIPQKKRGAIVLVTTSLAVIPYKRSNKCSSDYSGEPA